MVNYDPLEKYTKPVKEVLKEVADRVEKGDNPQLAFKESAVSHGLSGLERDKIEKRMDIAAILWDLYEIDINPIDLDSK